MVIKNSLLLVVDVQNGFVNKDTEPILGPINELVKRWRKLKGHIAFTRFINPVDGPWEKLMGWHGCKTEQDIRLHSLIESANDLVVDKKSYSGWDLQIEDFCTKQGIDTVIICGIDTDQCVLATAIDVFEADITPIVVSDCCASSAGDKFHKAGLLLLERLIGREQISDTESLIGGIV